jgi:hypothetical protein
VLVDVRDIVQCAKVENEFPRVNPAHEVLDVASQRILKKLGGPHPCSSVVAVDNGRQGIEREWNDHGLLRL